MKFEEVLPALRAGKMIKRNETLFKINRVGEIVEKKGDVWIDAYSLCFLIVFDGWEVVEETEYTNKILEDKFLGTWFRCDRCVGGEAHLYSMDGRGMGVDLTEIDKRFNVVGECKYSISDLDKMKFEVKGSSK